MSWRALAFRARDRVNALGPGRFLRVALVWPWRRRFVVLVRDLREPLPTLQPPPGLGWGPLAAPDLPALAAADPTMTRAEVERRLAEGQACMVCHAGGTLAGYSWSTTRPAWMGYAGLTLVPASGDVCGAGLFTTPGFRGQDVALVARVRELELARASGCTRAVGTAAGWNTPGLRLLARIGYRPVGTLSIRGLGRWRRWSATGAVRVEGRAFRVAPTPETRTSQE